ncbi:hypothetical protein JMJ77_0007544, partial [Colletotrichum scovillei]
PVVCWLTVRSTGNQVPVSSRQPPSCLSKHMQRIQAQGPEALSDLQLIS